VGKQSKAAKRKQRQQILENVEVRVPKRGIPPLRVRAFLGPTNSGKTYQALRQLVEAGRGTYAAPLRMLAREAFEKLSEELGDKVGLRTGEEQINPGAPIICATTEMAPMDGDMLVLDETHWAADSHRGSAWTRLLLGAQYKEMILLGSPDVLPLLQSCFGEDLEIESFQRLGKLEWAGEVSLHELRSGDALVAYSRKTVLHLASLVAENYGMKRVATLYGAMPLSSRIRELERVRSGEADLLVCTDVLGHGLNLPIRRMIFAETSKWDGYQRRDLLPWEAAQVAGRAGRYGQHNDGEVAVLSGAAWYEPKMSVARAGLRPKKIIHQDPLLYAFHPVSRGRLRPRLEDLGNVPSDRLGQAVWQWYKKARTELADFPWIDLEESDLLIERLSLVSQALGPRINEVAPKWLWELAQSPVDPSEPGQSKLLMQMTKMLIGKGDLDQWLCVHPEAMDLEGAERAAANAAVLLWFANRFGSVVDLRPEPIARLEERAANRVSELLPKAIQQGRGHCQNCGKNCPPWFDLCFDCAS
jgi:ATP-dependent RNA helicase SUPV3L1/SUV3